MKMELILMTYGFLKTLKKNGKINLKITYLNIIRIRVSMFPQWNLWIQNMEMKANKISTREYRDIYKMSKI